MAVYYADSCSETDIAAKIGEVPPGNLGHIVELPDGTADFTGTVSIPDAKVIEIRSANGKTATVITQTNTAGYGVPCFEFSNASTITGIGFVLDAVNTVGIHVHGQDFRIRECHATTGGFRDFVRATQIQTTYPIRGVVYNNTATNCRVLVAPVLNTAGMHYLWSLPSRIGTADMVFIEDNVFTATGYQFINVVDTNYGGSYVFRNNTVYGSSIEAHSFQSDAFRGSRTMEVYGNTIWADAFDMNYPWFQRGGELVIYDNNMRTANGFQFSNPHGFINDVRGEENRGGNIGISNGRWPLVDGNTAETGGSGTHSGSNGAANLTQVDFSWSTDQWVSGGSFGGENFSRYVYNTTTGASGQITANTSTTATVTLMGGSRQTWNVGDSYKITSGYPARDQIGRGMDSALSSGVAGSSQWNTQASVPAYAWNNTLNDNPTHLPVEAAADSPGHIIEGRDFFNGIARPGYTPYTYPNPLRNEGVTPVLNSVSRRTRSLCSL